MTQDQPTDHVAHPDLTFDHCTRTEYIAPPMTLLRMFGENRDPECSNAQPWWNNLWTAAAAALAAGIGAVYTSHGRLTAISLACTVLIVWAAIATVINPRRRHAFCELCGVCSVAVGVDPARTRKAAYVKLRKAGWSISADGRAHCRGHAEFPVDENKLKETRR